MKVVVTRKFLRVSVANPVFAFDGGDEFIDQGVGFGVLAFDFGFEMLDKLLVGRVELHSGG